MYKHFIGGGGYPPYVKYIVSSLLIGALVWHIYGFIQSCLIDFPIQFLDGQEFFITYGAGFVRRGLTGEVLMLLTKLTHISPITAIKVLVICVYVFFSIWMLVKCRCAGWSWWLCLSPLACGLTAYIIRKDYLQLALLIPILTLCKSQRINSLHGLAITFLIIIELLIHEAFFFWGAPIPMLMLLMYSRKKIIGAIYCGVILMLQVALCFHHGTPEIANAIIESWQGLFKEASELRGSGLSGLSWEAVTTFRSHIHMNFQDQTDTGMGWGVSVLRLVTFLINGFVVTQFVNTFTRAAGSDQGSEHSLLMTNLYLLLCVCMIPMFTLLSCDYARLYQYLTVTSMMSFLMLPHAKLKSALSWFFPRSIHRCVGAINRLSLTRRQWIVSILLLFAGDAPFGYDFQRWFSATVFGAVYDALSSLFTQ
ncbi:MAG: hypothetical protein NC187_06665 [Candidatus Amulumruptor caecigallinarius]|nr:hypothetical protein [Candidatus Amulumruptor caecigallinarius]MCM1397151.1 hypothetical protein [Candidatus Amulumruptor caecigallinarius]MCM1453160.1 hypothetical protein [bacterium]